MRKRRFIYNNDGTFILANGLHGGRPLSREDVEAYVDLVAGTQITSFFICTNSSMPYFHSRHERAIGCLTGDTPAGDGGHPHVGDNCALYGENLRILHEQGTDIVEICVSRAHSQGMEAFASMRMNDLHFNDPTIHYPLGQGDFWLQHPECQIGDAAKGWHASGALDFAHEAVRRYKLDILEEICTLFDIDGVELDFMRFPLYFACGEEHLDTMTDFVRHAREIVDAAGRQRGRALELGVRLPVHMEACRFLGLDPASWAQEDLVDFLTLTPFLHNIPSVHVAAFRRQLGDDRLPVYAGLMSHSKEDSLSHGAFRASAANCYGEGADGLSLFNFFYTHAAVEPEGAACFMASRGLLEEMGDAAILAGRNRIYGAGHRQNEYGVLVPAPLSAPMEAGTQLEVGIELAAEDTPQKALLVLRTRDLQKIEAIWNGTPLEAAPTDEAVRRGLARDVKEGTQVQAFALPVTALRAGENLLSLDAGSAGELMRADVAVEYGPPDTHGYF